MSLVTDFLADIVDIPYTIVGDRYMGRCNRCLVLLKQNNIDYYFIDTNTNQGFQLKQDLKQQFQYDDNPVVFKTDTYLGGYDELVADLA